MKPFLKIIAILLLLFNGVGAIYGGWNLITHPDGSNLHLSLDYLKYSPFNNYLIPGIILFLANGVFSLFVLGAILLNHKNFPKLIMEQGAILIGWIVIQVLMLHTIYFLHIILGATGILLMICGWLLVYFTFELEYANRHTR